MRLKILALLASVALVSACAQDQDISSGSSGAGKVASTTGSSSSSSGSSAGVGSSALKPGSKEEFVAEVGDRVFFDYDQSSFKKEGIETLKRQARFLIANQNITVTIEGHCDARGTREYNLALGERRAYSVKSFLTSLGVEDSRISIISFGKEKLQSLENNEKAWAQSRTAITTLNP